MNEYAPEFTLLDRSPSGRWALGLMDGQYLFMQQGQSGLRALQIPSGYPLFVTDLGLARRLLADLEQYGPDCRGAQSLLPWQLTYQERFILARQEVLVRVLQDSFLSGPDGFSLRFAGHPELGKVFGPDAQRREAIGRWLAGRSVHELAADCCLGNAFGSLNPAYVFTCLPDCREQLAHTLVRLRRYGDEAQVRRVLENYALFSAL